VWALPSTKYAKECNPALNQAARIITGLFSLIYWLIFAHLMGRK